MSPSSIAVRCASVVALMLLCTQPISAQSDVRSRVKTWKAVVVRHLPPPDFRMLYGSFTTLQILDVHSTRRAIGTGARELNPIMGLFTGNTIAMLGVKGAATTFGVRQIEKLRKRDARRAKILIVALNVAQAAIVVHNYRTGSGRK
jgi:Domain of unknown function (DUF5658)